MEPKSISLAMAALRANRRRILRADFLSGLEHPAPCCQNSQSPSRTQDSPNCLSICAGPALIGLLSISGSLPTAIAQKNKDDDKQEQQLRKQINALQQDLKQANNKIDNLQRELRERDQTINKLKANDKKDGNVAAELRKELTTANQKIRDRDELIALLTKQGSKDTASTTRLIEDLRKQSRELEALRKTPYLHTVIVRMKKEATAQQTQSLLDDIPTMLGKIPTVKGLWYGRRAEQVSPDFAVKDFEISLVILFDNYDGLIRYLDHPLHKSFLEKHLKNLEAPLVYDAVKP